MIPVRPVARPAKKMLRNVPAEQTQHNRVQRQSDETLGRSLSNLTNQTLSHSSCSEAGSEMVQWTPSGSIANVVCAPN